MQCEPTKSNIPVRACTMCYVTAMILAKAQEPCLSQGQSTGAEQQHSQRRYVVNRHEMGTQSDGEPRPGWVQTRRETKAPAIGSLEAHILPERF